MKFDTCPVYRTMRFCSRCIYVFKCCFLLDQMQVEKSTVTCISNLWARSFLTIILCDLSRYIKNLLVCCRIQQKARNTWNSENLCVTWARKDLHKGFTVISVVEFNIKYIKLTKFDILVNKLLFCSLRWDIAIFPMGMG